jgi:hypothetical protein
MRSATSLTSGRRDVQATSVQPTIDPSAAAFAFEPKASRVSGEKKI